MGSCRKYRLGTPAWNSGSRTGWPTTYRCSAPTSWSSAGQVRTSFGGALDPLCMDGEGNLVVVELKRGQTPRDVTSQALEYSSWVKDLEFDEIKGIADSYPGLSGTLETAFREKFGSELPDELNQGHRCLIVAESVDASTDRIVRYLAEMGVPINVATVQHFEDANGRELLAQVYLAGRCRACVPAKSHPRSNSHDRRLQYSRPNIHDRRHQDSFPGGRYSPGAFRGGSERRAQAV